VILFKQIGKLFSSESSEWISKLENKQISPVVIQKYLSQYQKSEHVARALNEYVYTLQPKQYLSLAWSMLFWNGKKLAKAPFIKYKKVETPHTVSPMQKQLHMATNDYILIKDLLQYEAPQILEVKTK
jgi:hypothetical protein